MLVINPGPTGASLVFVLCELMTCALIIQSIQFLLTLLHENNSQYCSTDNLPLYSQNLAPNRRKSCVRALCVDDLCLDYSINSISTWHKSATFKLIAQDLRQLGS